LRIWIFQLKIIAEAAWRDASVALSVLSLTKSSFPHSLFIVMSSRQKYADWRFDEENSRQLL